MTRALRLAVYGLVLVLVSPWWAMAQDCPSAEVDKVLRDPRVQDALDTAWRNSHEGMPDEHEEGGWIYQCQMPNGDGTFRYYTQVIPWPPGDIDGVGPAHPPRTDEYCRLVASYHTHPGGGRADNPGYDGHDNFRPSTEDILSAAEDGIPGIIRYGHEPTTPITDFTYSYGDMTSPRDPSWTCPGEDAPRSWSFGDPHVKTLDGYTYDFQAIGDFMLVESDRHDLEIQIRQQPYKDVNYAAINTALAVRDGPVRVEWSLEHPEPLVNGIARAVPPGAGVRLPSRGILRRTADGFLLITSAGDRVTVAVAAEQPQQLDFFLRLAAGRRARVHGLLGNFDDDPDNDLQTPDGRVVGLDGAGPFDAAQPLYSVFGAAWRVGADRTLLSRPFASRFDVKTFPAREPDQPEAAVAAAGNRCRQRGVVEAGAIDACAFDLVATRDDTFAAAAARASRLAPQSVNVPDGPIAPDREIGGALDAAHDRATYTATLARGTYVFDARGSHGTAWAIVGPDEHARFDANQAAFMGAYPATIRIDRPGRYVIGVSLRAAGIPGRFRFRVRTVPAVPVAPLALETETSGRIEHVGEERAYRLRLAAGHYVFSALAADDTAWSLTDAAGQALFDANQREFMESVSDLAIAETGTYTLTVRGRGTFGLGAYRLKVGTVPPSPGRR